MSTTVSTISSKQGSSAPPRGRYLAVLSLAALGIVYGDIGTSPLYAIRECFHGDYRVPLSPGNVLGVLSLIFWALTIVISIKYLIFILRADNRGEGGILALMSLIHPEHGPGRPAGARWRWTLVALGLFGAALLYGDGMITPAISVLSAVEGLKVATPVFEPYVIPITIVILITLFALQRRGTAGVGVIFGPVTLVWFLSLAALGIWQLVQNPTVLVAINPWHAVKFFLTNHREGFLVLGAVVLVVTGGEALYADMGHFGTRPIRLTWFALVLPSLLINYFGQGALLLSHPGATDNPFYRLAPQWALYPLVVLATAATVIASQAIISGAFSLTRQAIQLGFSPRMEIRHTSAREIGQIYIPEINWILMAATIGLVLGFRSSSHLAAAYGVAVTTTMVITTIIFYVVTRELWGWKRWLSLSLCIAFLVVDLAFFGSSLIKIEHGGWFPLIIGAGIFTSMSTWKRGREILASRLHEDTQPIEAFLDMVEKEAPLRVPGTAVFMSSNSGIAPHALLNNLQHNHILHEQLILLTIRTKDVPRVPSKDRLEVEDLGSNIYRMTGHYGFMETVNVPRLLTTAKGRGFDYALEETTFFLGRETLTPTKRPGMAIWREWLFTIMSRNAQTAASFFKIPVSRVLEIGVEIDL
jgi:KUP system potassium uptake protein